MKLTKGIHHLTAMTSSAEKIYDFFTHILGMRLVKKTVNQDDIQTYHLFFADDKGSPGTDVTFFDFPGNPKSIKGSDQIAKTGLRVPNNEALLYWQKRFEHYQVKHEPIQVQFGVQSLAFTDFDDQEYVLVSDENLSGVEPGIPWQDGPVPNEYAIYGLGPIYFRIKNVDYFQKILVNVMLFKYIKSEGKHYLYETGEGGNGARVIVEETKDILAGTQGYGGIHHVAFRVEDKKALSLWTNYLNNLGAPNSGYVDRFYFQSLYTRLYPGVLFEFATDGPGFIDDEESYEVLGEQLALPPKFRNRRAEIEKLVRPIDTKRSDNPFKKEYF